MQRLPIIFLALAMLALSACTGTTVGLTAAAVGIVNTREENNTPPDLGDQVAAHQSWCYQTLGYPECYPKPQISQNERLIGVDPENLYPLTVEAYNRVSSPKP